ncbi:hypothetical protein QOZ80_3AG0246370 [Eleusine coracana subsp. coracana]|nr:hypothetical protein QOZ80_3AG0246370 [Eleusine coracana subsp. coracana]
MMIAIGITADDQLLPLAFETVESENNESWSWFITRVHRTVVGPDRSMCMISDRHRSLLNAAKDHLDEYPPLVHRWCMRHFATNIWKKQSSKDVIKRLKALCNCKEEKKFDSKLKELEKLLNDDAKKWLWDQMREKEKWALAFDDGGYRVMARVERYLLLEQQRDRKHRAHLSVDLGQALAPLRVRSHKPLSWNDLYAPYMRRAGFLPLARVDAAMILGLRIDGLPFCAAVEPEGWHDTVEQMLGVRPPDPEQDRKDRKTTGVSSKWLRERFETLPADPDQQTIERYARAWLWHLVAGYLFFDGSGNTVSWLMLPFLTGPWEMIETYS